MKLGPNQQKWVDALRSGDYKQTNGRLRDNNGFCCLGVGCEIFDVRKECFMPEEIWKYGNENSVEVAPIELINALSLHDNIGTIHGPFPNDLANLNDNGFTFAEIADFIEREPQFVFRESK